MSPDRSKATQVSQPVKAELASQNLPKVQESYCINLDFGYPINFIRPTELKNHELLEKSYHRAFKALCFMSDESLTFVLGGENVTTHDGAYTIYKSKFPEVDYNQVAVFDADITDGVKLIRVDATESTIQSRANSIKSLYPLIKKLADSLGLNIKFSCYNAFDIKTLKLTGCYDLLQQSKPTSLSDAIRFIEKSKVELSGSLNDQDYKLPFKVYYNSDSGARYITPEIFAGVIRFVHNRKEFLDILNFIRTKVKDDNRAKKVKELNFLFVDRDTKRLQNENNTDYQYLLDDFESLYKKCSEPQVKSKKDWENLVPSIESYFKTFLDYYKNNTYFEFHKDKERDPVWVYKMFDFLTGLHSNLREETLEPIKTGYIGSNSKFVAYEGISSLINEQVEYVLEHSQEDLNVNREDIVYVCARKGMLGSKELAWAGLAATIAPEFERVVYLIGLNNGKESGLVLTKHPLGKFAWAELKLKHKLGRLNDETVKGYLGSGLSAEECADLASTYYLNTWRMYQVLTEIFGLSIPDLKLINIAHDGINQEYFLRSLIEGSYLDHSDISGLTYKALHKQIPGIANIAAVNIIMQRPTFSLHELLDQRDGNFVLTEILEAFSNSLNTNSPEEFCQKIAPLYALNIAYRIGNIHDLDEERRNELIKFFLESLDSSLEQIVAHIEEVLTAIDTIGKPYEELKVAGKEIPEKFDLTIQLTNALELIKYLSKNRHLLCSWIEEHALTMFATFSRVLKGKYLFRESDGEKEKTDIIAELAILTHDLFSANYHNDIIYRFLIKAVDHKDFTALDANDRICLFTVAKVNTWIIRLGADAKIPGVVVLAMQTNTASEFIDELRFKYSDLHINDKLANDYYKAITNALGKARFNQHYAISLEKFGFFEISTIRSYTAPPLMLS